MDFHLVHVSDLHFGPTPYPQKRNLSTWTRKIPGLELHDMNAVSSLASSLAAQRLLGGWESHAVVCTGDLTAYGHGGAFDLAYGYLREPPGSSAVSYSLHDSRTPVIPGNHDIWGGWIWGVGQHGQAVRDNYFNVPVPSHPTIKSCPYRVTLHNSRPSISLYGLDSTQLEGLHGPLPIWLQNARAIGYIHPAQLAALTKLVNEERAAGVPSLRIAAIHHPPVFPGHDEASGLVKVLVNSDQVLNTLRNLGFAIVLCGHLHLGFSIPSHAPSGPPLYILSVGTATQTTPAEPERTNEYRIYDFRDVNDHTYTMHIRNFKLRTKAGVRQFVLMRPMYPEIGFDLTHYV